MSRRSWIASAVAGIILVFGMGQAAQQNGQHRGPGARQERAAGERGERGERGGRGDMGQMRERMLGNLKEQMGVSDAEWKAILPKLEKVMALNRDLRGFGYMARGRGEQAAPAESELLKAQQALRTALQDKNASSEDISSKLKVVRDERAKARTALEAAQKELKAELKPRQEATLVLNGLLD